MPAGISAGLLCCSATKNVDGQSIQDYFDAALQTGRFF
jgi:hypothetical protein